MPRWSYLGMRRRVREIVAHPKAGDRTSKIFDTFIVTLILLNVAAMIVESVKRVHEAIPGWFLAFEYFSVAIFTAEYAARLWSCVEDPQYKHPVLGRIRFALTPLAIVDVLAVLPFYLPFLSVDLRVLRMFRLLRIMRLMRVAKLARYSESLQMLMRVLRAKREQLISAVFILLIMLVVAATLVYYAENGTQPKAFSSIPGRHVVGRRNAHDGRIRRYLSCNCPRQSHGRHGRDAGDRHVRPADRHPRRGIPGRPGAAEEGSAMPALRQGNYRLIACGRQHMERRYAAHRPF